MIEISVNNSIHQIKPETSLESLLLKVLPNSNGIAIALNEQVIPQDKWPHQTLTENDKILIIQATQGG